MTSIKRLTIAVAIIISLLSLGVYAQTPEPELNHFTAPGISFDYPAGYSVADESTAESQNLVLTRKGSSVQLTIVAPRRIVLRAEMPAALDDFKEPIIKKVETTLGLTNSAERIPIQVQLGSEQADGVRVLSSRSRNKTGEVIWLRSFSRLVALSFVRSNTDETVEAQLWETVRSSLNVKTPIVGTRTEGIVSPEGALKGGVLNGKAMELPRPVYPAIARAAHASGTVVVQVLIDEDGYVIAARAISGHPLLQAVSVAAAREARFTPTRLEGEPVKVSGVIEYNFVAQ